MLRSLKAYWSQPRTRTREIAETLAIALLVSLGFRAEVASAYFIPSESMLPTFKVGDRIFVEKLSPRLGPPSRGDVVVFDPPARAKPRTPDVWIKRVIALPGESVRIRDGQVFIDGQPLQEPYTHEVALYPEPDWGALGMPGGRVPEGAVFVMGDNRNNSTDGHVWGALPMRNIVGRTLFRYWPLVEVGPIGPSS